MNSCDCSPFVRLSACLFYSILCLVHNIVLYEAVLGIEVIAHNLMIPVHVQSLVFLAKLFQPDGKVLEVVNVMFCDFAWVIIDIQDL